VNGRPVKVVALPTKHAFLSVFNRETGEPIWPIEERPVPKGDVPGEWYSPTQPFPTRPPAYDRQGLVEDDLIDFTPELRAEALKLTARYKLGPIFTPPVVSKIDGPLATLAMASAGGGTNWPGGSYDPDTRTIYVSSTRTISQLGLVPPDPAKNDMAYVQGNAATGARTTLGAGAEAGAQAPAPRPAAPEGGGGGALTVQGLPLVKPPYGSISAISLERGEILWQVAHGETPDNIRNHPALKGLTIPRTGRPNTVGTLVTKTLVIAGESGFGPTPSGQRGAMLRAYDKATGREVGAVYIPAPQSGSPMTYTVNGRQHIVVAVSGPGYSGELVAFRLPREAAKPTASAAAPGGEPVITPLIHSSVQVEHAGKVIQVDPWSLGDLSQAKPADLLLVTDDVGHHLDVKAIQRLRKPGAPVIVPASGKAAIPDGIVLANGQSTTAAGVHVEAIAAYDLTPGEPSHPKGEANGYLVTLGDKRIYFAGVTECVPEVRALKNIDVAFFPMNIPVGRMTPAATAECVKVVRPKIVYIYHYDQLYASRLTNPNAKPQQGINIDSPDRGMQAFVDLLKGEPIEVRRGTWYPPRP
jgi:L-ascorbate metabolism protein UlaG (beta-lactamase superfamily)